MYSKHRVLLTHLSSCKLVCAFEFCLLYIFDQYLKLRTFSSLLKILWTHRNGGVFEENPENVDIRVAIGAEGERAGAPHSEGTTGAAAHGCGAIQSIQTGVLRVKQHFLWRQPWRREAVAAAAKCEQLEGKAPELWPGAPSAGCGAPEEVEKHQEDVPARGGA